jgi:CheY-like chemotaxis protein
MGKKILLADDSITIQKVIELTFSDEDFEVVTVGNGRLAIERVQEVRPDVVLCDIIMPEKDGYEVCEFIKKNPTLSQIPVLLLTGAFEPFDQERAGRVGCDGFLAKPFEPQTLIAKVKDLLKQAESRAAGPAVAAALAAVAPAPPPLTAAPFSVMPPAAPPAAQEPEPLTPLDDEEPFFAEPEAEAEPESLLPPPPIAAAPPLAAVAPPGPEPEVQFIPEEPFESMEPPPAPAASSSFDDYEPTFEPEPMPLPDPEPLTEPVMAAPPAPMLPPELEPTALEPEPDVETEPEVYAPLEEDEGGDELLPMTPEEEATLAQTTSPPTIEVPLEVRAQASVEAAQEPAEEPFFEEVFEAEPDAPPPYAPPAAPTPPAPAAVEAAPPPPPPPAPPPASSPYQLEQTMVEEDAASVLEGVQAMAAARIAETVMSEVTAAVAARPATESFRDVMPAEPKPAPAAASHAAEIPIPVDMVSQIAQRVVGQISEKVIREIAWEVIPDLAEALIRKEIERIKSEMQQ